MNGSQPGLLFNNGDPSQPAFPFLGVPDRLLTLNEDFDQFGRLIQTVGTAIQNGVNNQGLPTWGRGYMDASTENPKAGATEVWQIMNLTADTHPIHFHLVNVQLIQRQAFLGAPDNWTYAGDPMQPDPNEIGWKETVRMNPGEVTTVIMQFNLPNLPTAAMRNAMSPRTGGKEYVWHCHILEHEEHDMMRPIVVVYESGYSAPFGNPGGAWFKLCFAAVTWVTAAICKLLQNCTPHSCGSLAQYLH